LTIVISNLTLNWFLAILSNTSLSTCPDGNGLGVFDLVFAVVAVAVASIAVAPIVVAPIALALTAPPKSLGIGGNTFDLFETGELDLADPCTCN